MTGRYSIIKPDPLLQNNLMAFGFMCGRGWFPLLFQLLNDIQNIVDEKKLTTFEITEVKEKYGELRVYTNFIDNDIDLLIEKAQKKSVTICEYCGKAGTLINDHGWWTTLCPTCKNKGE